MNHATPEDLAMSRGQRIEACRRSLSLLLIHHGANPPDGAARAAVARLRCQIAAGANDVRPDEPPALLAPAVVARRRERATKVVAARPSRRRASDIDMEQLLSIAAAVMLRDGLNENELFSHRRNPALVRARHEIMYRAAKETKLSLPQIGRFLERDHSSVVHGIARHAERLGLARPRPPRGVA